MEVLVREVKRNNATLTSRNKLLHKSYLEQRERYIFLKRLNTRYLKDNTRLYRMISLQKLQMNEAKLNHSNHFTLETLAEAAVILQPLESIQATVNPPNTKPAEEETCGKKLDRTVLEVAQEFFKNRAFGGLGGR